jgi:hypothetical protein
MKYSFSIVSLFAGMVMITATGSIARADEKPLPGNGFPSSRYEALWDKSPFAVASTEASAPSSPDYSLVGIAEFDGTSYASLIETGSHEHFLLSSGQEARGLKLLSVTQGKGPDGTVAVVEKNGQSLTLKLESAPPASPPGIANVPAMTLTPQIPMPGANPGVPGNYPYAGQQNPPPIIFRRRIIRIPPQPNSAAPYYNRQTGAIPSASPVPVPP